MTSQPLREGWLDFTVIPAGRKDLKPPETTWVPLGHLATALSCGPMPGWFTNPEVTSVSLPPLVNARRTLGLIWLVLVTRYRDAASVVPLDASTSAIPATIIAGEGLESLMSAFLVGLTVTQCIYQVVTNATS